MSHYQSNLRDIEFNLFEFLEVQKRFGHGPYDQIDLDTAHAILDEMNNVATGPFAESFEESDRVPLELDDGEVTIPDGVKASLDVFFDGEWGALQLPQHLGGYAAPNSLMWACISMMSGSNPAATMYTGGPSFAAIADGLVTDEQRERWIRPMVDRQWGSTMVLTEPDAGSDVGAGRTKAVEADDGTWHLTGTKRFITNGDFDWPENIIHLVLARPEGGKQGTKGLSLFIVPKYWVNEDGSLGERNGAVVTNLEHKMGLKGSSTCELTFGEHEPARGILVGEVHDGIRQMFKVIEHARMMVGIKAMETLSTGYLNALDYAKQRVQGPDLARASDKAAPRTEIVNHPDVRRMLMDQKAHVEGMRALAMYTASIQDEIERLGRGAAEVEGLTKRNDLLLPLVKAYCSEKAYHLLSESLQTFGGSGYLQDYPIEQYIRDSKIDSLYEGTTGIQGMDLFFRKIGKDQGETLNALFAEIQETAKGDAGNGALAAERARLATALEDVQEMLGTMAGFLNESIYQIGLNTTPFLFSLSELVIGWLLVEQAEVAHAALAGEPGDDRAFYEGKVAAARHFTRTVLPQLSARRTVVETTDSSLMELETDAF
jgi:alkylation response protein AidB-like acyl-CoA dehydrogenase